eukprot:CAMPEP_0198506630 /NCGR_PEP_ID=MMETSP1462-20131121/11817_1 /TAXON_ID=1333877 /ORGANISM="Brandtodinium nutriculum, Strain RCC3387" /LENGTH=65 /DNA_ID=CAMNT_0044235855 /DNA_START=60 /DNA_END=254 /DNA_ORIENTATION=-
MPSSRQRLGLLHPAHQRLEVPEDDELSGGRAQGCPEARADDVDPETLAGPGDGHGAPPGARGHEA